MYNRPNPPTRNRITHNPRPFDAGYGRSFVVTLDGAEIGKGLTHGEALKLAYASNGIIKFPVFHLGQMSEHYSPAKSLSREEIERLYPGKKISPKISQPSPAPLSRPSDD